MEMQEGAQNTMTTTKQTAKRDAARGNTPAATVAYNARHAETADILKRIAKQLAAHAKEQADLPWDWGFPGDLGHVNEEVLALVLASLGDRTAVERDGDRLLSAPRASPEPARMAGLPA